MSASTASCTSCDRHADRVFVLQSAGNLATTQEVLDRIRHDLQAPAGTESLATVSQMYQAALYVGRISEAWWMRTGTV